MGDRIGHGLFSSLENLRVDMLEIYSTELKDLTITTFRQQKP